MRSNEKKYKETLDADLDFWIKVGDSVLKNRDFICCSMHFVNEKFNLGLSETKMANSKKEIPNKYQKHFYEWFECYEYSDSNYPNGTLEYWEHWNGGTHLCSDFANDVLNARLMAVAFMYVFTERKAQKKA